MDIQQSIDTVQSLANGVNPVTGELFPDHSPYNHPEIVRALFFCVQHMKQPPKVKKTVEQKQAENLAKGQPKNAGMPWTPELKTELATGFNAGVATTELARQFERSKSAIVSELIKQGLIDEDDKQY